MGHEEAKELKIGASPEKANYNSRYNNSSAEK